MHPKTFFTTNMTGKFSATARSEDNLPFAIGEKNPPHPSIKL